MKRREYEDLRKKDADELRKLVDEKRTEVMGLRFSLATGALEDPSRLGEAKRDVARMLTLLGEKKKAEATA
jgi:ribosomal protein L29